MEFRTSGGVLTQAVEYTYDVFDRRIGKAVDDDGDGDLDRSERFVYDGDDVVLVFDGGGSLTTRYLHGPAVDQVFASEDALGDVLWALADHQGSVRDLAEYDAGTGTTSVANHRKYDSFGRITAESNPSAAFRYAYTGRVWDADAELFYYRARWYDPAVGRFLSEDPLGFAAGDVNLTRYVGNSPVNFVDPTGMRTESVLVDGHEVPLNPWDDPEAYSLVFVMNLGTDDGGYSNWFTEWFGEGAIRPYFGDERLTEPGGLGDDLLLSTRLATEITGILDPTPLSDILNATTHLIDGNHGEGGMALAGAAIPGGIDKLARHGDVLLKPIGKLLGFVPGGCFVAGTLVLTVSPTVTGVTNLQPILATNDAESPTRFLWVAAIGIPAAVVCRRRRKRDDTCAVDLEDHNKRRSGQKRSARPVPGKPIEGEPDQQCHPALHVPPLQTSDLRPLDASGATAAMTCRSQLGEGVVETGKPRRRRLHLGVMACLLLGMGLLFGRPAQHDFDDGEAIAFSRISASAESEFVPQPIERIRVGQRIPGQNPTGEEDLEFGRTVDPASWRRIELRASKADGTWADVVLLRPETWLREHAAAPGWTVDISVPECGIDGRAVVRSIGPCPAIPPGPGQVVTGTFRHASARVIDVQVEGLKAPIGTTANHPFWSADRSRFVRADELRPGERLKTLTGFRRVLSVKPCPGTAPVYNLEVQVAHVYHVSSDGVLVHNSGLCPKRMTPDQQALKELVDEATNGARKPLSTIDAETILDWAEEVNYPGWRAGVDDVSLPSHWDARGGHPHIHIPGVGTGHIPVEPGVTPR